VTTRARALLLLPLLVLAVTLNPFSSLRTFGFILSGILLIAALPYITPDKMRRRLNEVLWSNLRFGLFCVIACFAALLSADLLRNRDSVESIVTAAALSGVVGLLAVLAIRNYAATEQSKSLYPER
jgi:hypothetical protein